jgi:cell shape-determining protein MreC
VSARTNSDRVPGVVEPSSAGNPTDLLLKFPGSGRIQPGDRIVTRGTISTSTRLPSLFPPGLPIGQVTRIEDPGADTQEVHLRPFADLRRLDFVQVLTHIPTSDDS